MKAIDWIGLVLVGGVVVGGVVYFVKTRPLQPARLAQPGYIAPVQAQGQNFGGVAPNQPQQDQGVKDANMLIGTIGTQVTGLINAFGNLS